MDTESTPGPTDVDMICGVTIGMGSTFLYVALIAAFTGFIELTPVVPLSILPWEVAVGLAGVLISAAGVVLWLTELDLGAASDPNPAEA